MKNTKKIIAIILAVLTITLVFGACSSKKSADDNSVGTHDTTIPTEEAKVKENDAIKLIQTYSAKELGLDGDIKDYKFMVSGDGATVIDKKNYVQVVAAKVSEKDDDGNVKLDIKGEYDISFDGEEILVKNLETNEYSKMKEVHDVPEDTTTETTTVK